MEGIHHLRCARELVERRGEDWSAALHQVNCGTSAPGDFRCYVISENLEEVFEFQFNVINFRFGPTLSILPAKHSIISFLRVEAKFVSSRWIRGFSFNN